MKKETKSVAVVQMNCEEGNVPNNCAAIIDMIRRVYADAPTVKLIVFPEMILYGYSEFEHIRTQYSQNEIEKYLMKIADVCATCQIEVIVGAPFMDGEQINNALYHISEMGVCMHIYSKMHLIEVERGSIKPGNQYAICNTCLGKTGVLICWDGAFIEGAGLYQKMGVDAIINCAAWEAPYLWQWKLAIAGSSMNHSIPVLGANRVGKNGVSEFVGHAMITDCIGNVLAECESEEEDYVIVDVDSIKERNMIHAFGSPVMEKQETEYSTETIKMFH